MKEEFVSNIYQTIIPIILEKTEEEYQQEVMESLSSKLENKYSEIEITPENYGKLLTRFSELERKFWGRLSSEQILGELIQDDAFEELGSITQKAFASAMTKKKENTTIPKEEAEQDIKKMEELLEKVMSYHKAIATSLVGDATLELKYASNQTSLQSLRMR